MDKSMRSVLAVPLCLLLTWCVPAQCSDLANGPNEAPDARIVLTKFELTDTALELSFQITNTSDHNVWICGGITVREMLSEVYLAKDEQSLVVRRRLDVPSVWSWSEPPAGFYVRLRPGEEHTESLSLALPIERRVVFADQGAAEYATHVVLEIGFYDRDLPGLIRGILAQADKFTGDLPLLGDYYLLENYFPGLLVKRHFRSLSWFNESHKEISNGQLVFGYMFYTWLAEQVLRLEVDGVHIPYNVPEWLRPPNDDPACETVVAGDINGDCKVNFADFELMAVHWLQDHSQ